MRRAPLPDQDYLIHCLAYNAETGELRWRERPTEHFSDGGGNHTAQSICRCWNTINAGKLAFNTPTAPGYLSGTFEGQRYYAHRIIWKLAHGTEPIDVDHINGVKTDNRLCNLRAASRSENARNGTLRVNNTSGFMGVSYKRERRKWQATIWANGTTIYLGLFGTREEAAAARKVADVQHGYHPNHGRARA